MRMDPPPSPPEAMGTSPPATTAADPPEEPPGVRSRFHGLRVVPCSLVWVRLMPPNSLDVVWPTSTAPAPTRRRTWVELWCATRSAKTSEASVKGHPSTGSSSLMPTGSPPKGSDTSAAAAAAVAASASTWLKAFNAEPSMAARHEPSASDGDISPRRYASTSEQASPDHGEWGTGGGYPGPAEPGRPGAPAGQPGMRL